MDEQVVMFTDGAYSDYEVCGHLVGPSEPPIRSLVARFCADYLVRMTVRHRDCMDRDATIDRLRRDGVMLPEEPHGLDASDLLRAWLTQRHGFRSIAVTEVHGGFEPDFEIRSDEEVG